MGVARMQGKVAIITGGGGGIGRATAVRFAEEGAKVAVFDIDQQLGEESAQIATAAARDGGGASFFNVDVTDADSVRNGVDAAVSAYGEINTLHNNAGGSTAQDGPVTEAPEEEFWRVIKLDLYGTFLCSKHIIPRIIEAGGGSVINVSSIASLRGPMGRVAYAGTKGAVDAMTRALAADWGPHGIRVNAISPGLIKTAIWEEDRRTVPGLSERLEQQIALKRWGDGSDVADVVVFLASDASRYVTGEVIAVDGGMARVGSAPRPASGAIPAT